MNMGQLTSITHCESCHMPLAIFPHETEIICKFCGTKNNLLKEVAIDDGFKLSIKPIHRLKLNVDKIKTIDDVKRILEFIGIGAEIKENITNDRFKKVKDLFEQGE